MQQEDGRGMTRGRRRRRRNGICGWHKDEDRRMRG